MREIITTTGASVFTAGVLIAQAAFGGAPTTGPVATIGHIAVPAVPAAAR